MPALHIHLFQFPCMIPLVGLSSTQKTFKYGNNLLKRLLSIYIAGPEAAKYITNHAAIKAIFCMPQTLYNVRLLA